MGGLLGFFIPFFFVFVFEAAKISRTMVKKSGSAWKKWGKSSEDMATDM